MLAKLERWLICFILFTSLRHHCGCFGSTSELDHQPRQLEDAITHKKASLDVGGAGESLGTNVRTAGERSLSSYQIVSGYQQMPPKADQCEKINIEMCADMPYNMTFFPNLLNHQSQHEAAVEIANFGPLIQVQCSAQLHFFLCAMFFPICVGNIDDGPLPPCRTVCEGARNGCEHLMNKFGFSWPKMFDCSNADVFPQQGGKQLCVFMNESAAAGSGGGASGRRGGPGGMWPSTAGGKIKLPPGFAGIPKPIDVEIQPGTLGSFVNSPGSGPRFAYECPAQMQTKFPEYVLRLGNETVSFCALPCGGVFFGAQETAILRCIIGVWASICMVSTTFVILTFLVDTTRFPYPERPIIFLALCFWVVSCLYLIGFWLGDRVACNRDAFNVLSLSPDEIPPAATLGDVGAGTSGGLVLDESLVDMPRLVTQGLKMEWCTVLGMLHYFFTMASHLWWVILTFAWFLAAVLKWSPEAIGQRVPYFHAVGWAIPAVLTIVVMARENIDGDPYAGICSVGNWNPGVLQWFVIAPLAICLGVGLLFIGAGFASLFQIRQFVKQSAVDADNCRRSFSLARGMVSSNANTAGGGSVGRQGGGGLGFPPSVHQVHHPSAGPLFAPASSHSHAANQPMVSSARLPLLASNGLGGENPTSQYFHTLPPTGDYFPTCSTPNPNLPVQYQLQYNPPCSNSANNQCHPFPPLPCGGGNNDLSNMLPPTSSRSATRATNSSGAMSSHLGTTLMSNNNAAMNHPQTVIGHHLPQGANGANSARSAPLPEGGGGHANNFAGMHPIPPMFQLNQAPEFSTAAFAPHQQQQQQQSFPNGASRSCPSGGFPAAPQMGGSGTASSRLIKVDKLDKLMVKVTVFSIFYNVSAIILLACLSYHSLSLSDWLLTWFDIQCLTNRAGLGFDKIHPGRIGSSIDFCPSRLPAGAALPGGAADSQASLFSAFAGLLNEDRADRDVRAAVEYYSRSQQYAADGADGVAQSRLTGSSPNVAPTGVKLTHWPRPEFAVFVVRYILSLVVGVASLFWTWSIKTCFIWQAFFGRFLPAGVLGSDRRRHQFTPVPAFSQPQDS